MKPLTSSASDPQTVILQAGINVPAGYLVLYLEKYELLRTDYR